MEVLLLGNYKSDYLLSKKSELDELDNEYSETFSSAHNDKWAKSFAGKPLFGIRVNPLDLDPFVARYVNAVNGIGSKTISSCDGWHKNSNNVLYIEFKDRYSMIWHKLLFGLIEDNHGIEWEHKDHTIELKLPVSDNGKLKKYIALNKNAEYFEIHQKELLEKKAKVISALKGLKKKALSNKEAEEMITNAI